MWFWKIIPVRQNIPSIFCSQDVIIQPAEDVSYTLISLRPHIAYSFSQIKLQ